MSTIRKGRFVMYGMGHPDVSLPGFTIKRTADDVARVFDGANEFIISRDEATKDWLLIRRLEGNRYDFDNPAHRFPITA